MMRIASLLVFLILQRSAAAILLHEAGTEYSVALIVLLGELLKQFGSILIGVYQHIGESKSDQQNWHIKRQSDDGNIKQQWVIGFKWFFREAWQQNKTATCFPAALYVLQNNLYLYASSRLLPGIVQGLWQVRLVPIAIFSQLILSKNISRAQWSGLLVTLIGIVILQQGHYFPEIKSVSSFGQVATINSLLPVCAILLAAVFSSLASVLLERLFIDRKTNLWVANYQLSIFSLPPALLLLMLECARSPSLFDPFRTLFKNIWPAIAILIQGLAGLLVALTTKYAGSVAAGLSGVASIALTRMIQLLRGTGTSLSEDSSFFGGFVLIVIGFSTYIRSSPQRAEHNQELEQSIDDESHTALLLASPSATSPQFHVLPLYNDMREKIEEESTQP